MSDPKPDDRPHLSVVCPFYNEAGILDEVLRALLQRLRRLERSWELIVVDDGSTDASRDVARAVEAEAPDLTVLAYDRNRGRGHALRTGIRAARGDVIVTTEIDLSWGEDIVEELADAMDRWPEADVVIASPHLEGGGYKNVPGKRVFLSRFGNRIIRACMSQAPTMNTGMTRAYRRDKIRSLPLFEDRKEFHLEVVLKALAFGYVIREIPALLEWKEFKSTSANAKPRKSSSKVPRLILSHTLFSLLANPVRYVWALALAAFGLGILAGIGAVIAIIIGEVSVYMALLSVSLVILGLIFFVFGVILKQGYMIQRELWTIQRHQLRELGPDEELPS